MVQDILKIICFDLSVRRPSTLRRLASYGQLGLIRTGSTKEDDSILWSSDEEAKRVAKNALDSRGTRFFCLFSFLFSFPFFKSNYY